ncbi:MAG: preprotein translocase subunit SecE [Limnochordia bacterium]|jgi:preprotein translocase subunit SecE|nr:preprotein translocase subunit SecE [Limnochordia bacterium]MDD2629135.1 preprotein translocase subunit SecE [Limnochordia bacterium]MDD4517076.1 preprotein translocase subunit SecE [Limnochordia bacterium]
MATVPNKDSGWERVKRFFREVRAEMRKVVWPDRQELMTYTGVVIVTVVIAAAFIGLADLVVAQILRLLQTLGG